MQSIPADLASLQQRQEEELNQIVFGLTGGQSQTSYVIGGTGGFPNSCNSSHTGFQFFIHGDHLGSTSYLTDERGLPYQFMMYLPYGETMIDQRSGVCSTPYRYTPLARPTRAIAGQELDEMTQLYYYGARYYNPRIGNFMSVDPLADAFPSQSPYLYAYNNPIRFIDVDGLYGDESEATKQRKAAIDQGLNVGDIYQSGNEWGFNIVNGENSYSAFSNDYAGENEFVNSTIDFLKKSVLTVGEGLNISAGYGELQAGAAAMVVPSGVTQVGGGYLMLDGYSRIAGSGISIYGIWTENQQLEDSPSNFLGVVGMGLNSYKEGDLIIGGDGQFAMEIAGDLGLARRQLMKKIATSPILWKRVFNGLQYINNITRPYRQILTDERVSENIKF